MRKSGIEWTDDTWNPIRGCSRISAGCMNCYAEDMAHRFSGPGKPYEGLTNDRGVWNGTIRVVDEHMTDPLRWRDPRRIFVNSMSDLFHEAVSDETIDTVFAVMALASRHTFQVLTKRPDRMLAYMDRLSRYPAGHCWENALRSFRVFTGKDQRGEGWIKSFGLPLPNVHLGVSVENQSAAETRIPLLLQTHAAVRFLSLEPLIDRVDVSPWLTVPGECLYFDGRPTRGVDWMIVGGESGPGARPCALEWVEGLVEQARRSLVPVFVKQLGAYVVSEERSHQSAADLWHFDSSAKWPEDRWAWRAGFEHPKGGDIHEWPDHLQVREFPRS